MPSYKDLEQAVTRLRLQHYYSATKSQLETVNLYYQQAKLALCCFNLISTFEIILRNKIDSFLTARISRTWLMDLTKNRVFNNTDCKKSYLMLKAVKNRWTKNLHLLDHNQFISQLSFGFWHSLFLDKQFTALNRRYKANLLDIFTYRPPDYNQTIIEERLRNIRNQRNRIAHSEPLIFNKDTDWSFSFADIDLRKDNIIEMLDWLDINYSLIEDLVDEIEQQKTRTHI